jgi:hypothetical protein
MKFLNYSSKALVLITGFALVYGCKKVNTAKPLGGAGNTIVKLPSDEGYNLISLNLQTTPQTFALLEIRRDVPNETELNKTTVVIIQQNQVVISDFNSANGTSYVVLPYSSFTVDPANPRSGNDFRVTFNPGEFFKEIKITIPDATVLDPGESYALGFRIASVDGGGKISGDQNEILVEIGLKNKWDGKYTLHGDFYHPTQSPNWDPFTVDVEMWTSGASSVKMYFPDLGGFYHPGLFLGTLSAFGAQEPEYTINPATNAVTVQNSYPGAVTFYTMFAGYNSHYDPATKTIYAKFGYNLGPGGTFVSGSSRAWTDTLIYNGPR